MPRHSISNATLPLFESSARLTTVNAGPIDPLVTMLFCLEVSKKLPQG